jgi:signal transduction histidine kinase/DNA-binding response OmpR family regulator
MKKTSTKKESEAEINELIEIASNHTVKAIELEKLENKIDIFCKKSLEEIGFKTQISLLKVYKKQKNSDKFEALAEKLVENATKLNEIDNLGSLYRELSVLNRSRGDYPRSLDYITKSIEIYLQTGNAVKYAISLNSLGNYHLELGEYSQALANYYKAFENIKSDGNSEAYHVIKHSLALVYLTLNYYNKAKELYSQDLEILKEEKNYERYVTCLIGISDVYLEESRGKLAYKYAKLAVEYIEPTGFDRKKASAYLCLGNSLIAFEKYDEALNYFEKARVILEKIEQVNDLLKLEHSIGALYLTLKEYDKAIYHLEISKEIAVHIKQNFELRKIYNALYKSYEGANQRDEAYLNLKNLTILNETMFNFALQAKVNDVQTNFELEKKELEFNKEREVNEYKNNLFSYITHEFRTPLTLINTPIEMMKNENDINVIKARMVGVTAHVAHMQHLLDQLLDINKIEEGKMPVLKKAGNINPLLWHVVHLYEPEMSDKNIDFVYNMPRKNIQAYFDTDKIEKIINNLLSNALKYTSEGGKIIFNADFDKTSSNLILEIMDNGIGIDLKYQEEIFNKYYRIPNNKDVKGSGLGLSFVKELVLLLGGDIQLESERKKGSKFTVIIPIERLEKSIKHSNSNANKANQGEKQESILIVEDNYEIQKLLKEVFTDKYKVYTADHGKDAIQKIAKHVPDVVLSDIKMPLMSGIELCEFIKKDKSLNHIPVILLTAKSAVHDKIEGLESGADAYITKPFNILELMQTIETTLAQRKKIMERFSSNPFHTNADDMMSSDRVFMEKVTTFILENMENESLSVNDLAKHLNVSRFTLIRKFKKINDATPNTYIQKVRLEKAKELIKNKVANVTEIAFKVGFGSTTYFSYSFKKEFGISPKEYYQSSEKN